MVRLRLPSPTHLVRGRALPWTLAALLLASTLLFLFLWRGGRAQEAHRAEVAASARTFLRALTTFGAGTIERDVAEIRSHATGQFAEEVERTFSPQRIQEIRQARVESVGTVRDVFVQSLEGTEAELFAAVDETVRNEAAPQGRTDVLRISLEMIRTTEGWKVAAVEILQSPGEGLPLP